VGNAVPVIAAALLPGAVLGLEAMGATPLPFASLLVLLRDFLSVRALLLDRSIGLPLRYLLIVPVVLLLLLGVLLRVPVLLLLGLLPVLILLLLLGVLLRSRFLLLLLGVLLRGRSMMLLLAPLLRGLGLIIRLFLLVAFLFLLCVPESGGSEKYYQNCSADNIRSFHKYFLTCSLNS
jgi:hypothetical protein